jgi:hypothetical protein
MNTDQEVPRMTPTLSPTTPLTALDRCDRCGAQAYVRVTLAAGGDLLFCGHHFREHEARLRPLALDVQDETAKLVEPATPAVEG